MTEQVHKQEWQVIGLSANGPKPGMEDKLHLFGQFVGDWDIQEERYLLPDGTWRRSSGEIHWNWILDGKAVQDVWGGVDSKTNRFVPIGTTVRFYDAKIDAWRSTWISPDQSEVKMFIGRKVGEEIVLETRSADGREIKWIFSEITQDSFRWHAEESKDNGKTWTLTEEMHIRRHDRSKHP